MARITVEDCLTAIGSGNRFDLIRLATQRVRQRRKGSPCLVEGKNKELVMTLREIAAKAVTFQNIDGLVQENRRGTEESAAEGRLARPVETPADSDAPVTEEPAGDDTGTGA
ncbi:MAG: DNA-directed RNA polymerase subunit omega [Desulfobulbaceae bacterium A2]|nr:MAG: DNA-directed RNA polymerase subunit omega [Desulfobulbaceae bacterium A2]